MVESDIPEPNVTFPVGGRPAGEVLFQIPARGNQELRPDEARRLASWIRDRVAEHQADAQWLELFFGEPPLVTAEGLEQAADQAEGRAAQRRQTLGE